MINEIPVATKPIEQLSFWLALLRLPGIGLRKFHAILKALGEPAEFFNATAAERREWGFPANVEPDWPGIEKDLAWLAAASTHAIIVYTDPQYPQWLKEIATAPPILFIKGDPRLLLSPQLAMVGSRNPTQLGIETAHEFAVNLASAGIGITSGLALGIDAACHRGALEAKGHTIAVLGTSLEQIYPKKHHNLAAEIVANGGALVSEFPIGTPPCAEHFPQRNRIISGLSRGVLVIEATQRSGSLITARFANEQGREVFAIPGSIHNPMARGCHALIKQGAKLVETTTDILEELEASLTMACPESAVQKCNKELKGLDEALQQLLKCIGFEPTSIDKLMERCQLARSDLLTKLLVLELKGYIAANPNGYVRVKT